MSFAPTWSGIAAGSRSWRDRPPRATGFRKLVARNPVPVGAASILTVSLIAFAIAMSVLYGQSTRRLERARVAEATAAAEARAADTVSEFMMSLFRTSNPAAPEAEALTARDLLERAVERVDYELADQPLVRSRLLGTLGDTYAGLGLYDESRRLHERGLELKRKTPGATDRNLAVALNNYATLLSKLGEHDAALAAHREALGIRERALGADHPEVGQSLSNMGLVWRSLGELDSSRVCYERALAIKRAAHGPDDPLLASTLSNLGGLHLMEQDHEGALAYFDEAYRINEKNLGSGHMRTIQTMSARAGALHLAGELDRASTVQADVVEALHGALGPDHPEVGVALRNLSMIEAAVGDTTGALTHAERALEIYERVYGTHHERVVQALAAIAELMAARGQANEARPLALRGMAIIDSLGIENRTAMWQLDVLGDIERRLGNESEAVARFTRALAIAERMFGPTHEIPAEIRTRLRGPEADDEPQVR